MKMKSNITKETIISSLEVQLNSLIKFYEYRLKEMGEENIKIKSDFLALKKEFDQLISIREDKVNQNVDVNNNDIKGGIKSPLESPGILTIQERLSQLKRISSLEECSDTLAEINALNLKFFKDTDLQMLSAFLRKIIHFNSEELFVKRLTYKLILSIIKRFVFSKEFKVFLKTNSNRLNEMIIETKDYKLMIELTRIYFLYNHFDNLPKLITVICDELQTLKYKVLLTDFVITLWFSFFLDKDNRLKSNPSLVSFFNESDPAIEAYQTYYKTVKGDITYEKGWEIIKNGMEHSDYFTLQEKEKLLKSIEKRLKKNIQKYKTTRTNQELIRNGKNITRIWYIIKLPENKPSIKERTLQESLVELAVFNDVFLKENSGHIFVKVYYDEKTGLGFVTKEQLINIKSRIGKKWVSVRSYYDNDMKATETTNYNNDTSDREGISVVDEDAINLNELSELRMIGYQITGLTKIERWRILERAVDEIGLRKVVLTIAQNIKLRKGQKNGKTKYRYAITEWEYDLYKLRKTYFKHQFPWPVV